MKIFPAIDIKGGKCVRLLKGDFANLTQYDKSPLNQANTFVNFGFKYLHLIDLDGALEGRLTNKNIIQFNLPNHVHLQLIKLPKLIE